MLLLAAASINGLKQNGVNVKDLQNITLYFIAQCYDTFSNAGDDMLCYLHKEHWGRDDIELEGLC